jgi:hypothetical protein
MKKILAVSDFHFGSSWGLWPPNFEAEDPRTGDMDKWIMNPTQERLWKMFQFMCEKAKDVDIIIFNGDLCDGPQRKAWGKGTKTPDLNVQAKACEHAIKLLPDVPKYFTQGSEYHTMNDRPLEQYIAERAGGEFGDDLCIDECGIRIYARHFIPVSKSAWMYRTTPVARDLMLLALSDTPEHYGKVDLAIFSHAHYKCGVILGGTVGVITPCFQARTPFAVKVGITTPPDIGFCIIEVEEGPEGRQHVNPKFYSHKIGKPCKIVGREAQCRK